MPFGASILLMVYMILIKNKNKNKYLGSSGLLWTFKLGLYLIGRMTESFLDGRVKWDIGYRTFLRDIAAYCCVCVCMKQ